MKRIIKKAKITKGRTVEVTLTEILDDKSERECMLKCDQLYHDDLAKAFDKLKPHLVCICDQKGSDQIADLEEYDESLLTGISVTSFTISGSSESEGIVLVGQKEIGDKVLNLISPFTMYEDDYKFSSELGLAIAACVFETEEYLFNAKYAIKQLDLFEDQPKNPDSGEFQSQANEVASAVLSAVLSGEKKKRGGKKINMFSTKDVEVSVSAESF